MSKGREGPAAGGGATAILLRYLREQNRPYSAQDVFGNLQREHGLGKAAVVKALEQLAQQGHIREKAYGKQKVYFADQVSPGPGPAPLPSAPLSARPPPGAAPGRWRCGAPRVGRGHLRAVRRAAGAAAGLPAAGGRVEGPEQHYDHRRHGP